MWLDVEGAGRKCSHEIYETFQYYEYPDRVNVVIVGGGISGCGLLELAKKGVTDVALFEKGELTSYVAFSWPCHIFSWKE